MSAHGWHCPVDGCTGRGAGYPAQRKSAAALWRHLERGSARHFDQFLAVTSQAKDPSRTLEGSAW